MGGIFGFLTKPVMFFLSLSFKKKLLVVGIIVVIAIVIGVIVRNNANNSGYVFENVQKTNLSEVVSESGEIVSNGDAAVYSPTNGYIAEMYVQNGQQVKKGQNLFKVISNATEQEKQTAYASYLSAKATLEADTASLYSLQSSMFAAWKVYTDLATNSTYQNSDGSPVTSNRVLPAFTTAQDDWFAAESKYKNQQGVIAKDNASVASSWTAYQATQTTTITAQMDGTVANISAGSGDSVAVQSLLDPSPTPVLLLTNDTMTTAKISVGQSNIAKIQKGQKIVILPDAYKDKTYTGTVLRIDSIGQNAAGVVTYNVYAQVDDNDNQLRAGMTFDVDITTKEVKNVLTVSNGAIVLYQGGKAIRILKNNTVTYIPVIIGVKGLDRTEIVKGVTENQQIISALTNVTATRPGLLGL